MVSALSTGHEIGLAVTGGAFIGFSLLSSFVLPRANANFPGRGRNWYLLLCLAFFVAMMSAVLVFGREKKAAQGATGTTAATAPAGNAAAGKLQFTSSGCVACHTFKPAGATAKIGPDLDNLAAYAQKAGQPIDAFATAAISNPPAPYVPPGYPTNTMPKFPLTPTQVANLVAFLTSK